jgi:hypothetical protein
LSLMGIYRDMPGAMSDELISKVESAFMKPVLAEKDVCHA